MKNVNHFSIIIVVMAAYLFAPLTNYGPQLEIYVLNVGQGDSTLIVTPNKQRVLIDGGRDSAVLSEIDKVIPLWSREIDTIMLTHSDTDHIAGLIDVLNRYKVDQVLFTPIHSRSEVYKEFLRAVHDNNVDIKEFSKDSNIKSNDGFSMIGLWPESDRVQELSTNGGSQVGLLKYGHFTGLFTGDIDTEIANKISDSFIDINFLKVPHHGSKFNLTLDQMQALAPELSTISVGENTYGHPSTQTVQNLKLVGSEVYRTDIAGTIKISVDLSGFSVTSE